MIAFIKAVLTVAFALIVSAIWLVASGFFLKVVWLVFSIGWHAL